MNYSRVRKLNRSLVNNFSKSKSDRFCHFQNEQRNRKLLLTNPGKFFVLSYNRMIKKRNKIIHTLLSYFFVTQDVLSPAISIFLSETYCLDVNIVLRFPSFNLYDIRRYPYSPYPRIFSCDRARASEFLFVK